MFYQTVLRLFMTSSRGYSGFGILRVFCLTSVLKHRGSSLNHSGNLMEGGLILFEIDVPQVISLRMQLLLLYVQYGCAGFSAMHP